MAKSTLAIDFPRFLLPQRAWTVASLTRKAAAAKRPSSLLLVRENAVVPFRSVTFQRALHTTVNRRSAVPDTRYQQTLSKRSSPAVQRSAAESVPVRYNGVYAAAFNPARKAFSTSAVRRKDHHFDTLKFVRRLRGEGFSDEQAVAMMRVLNDVIEESIQNLTRTMVLKEDAERSTYTQKVDFAKLRSELSNADSSESQLTRSSHERLSSDLAKLSSRLRDEISRTQASVRLDLNLEKGRIREEATGQEMRIKETEARIEQEVAGLRERVEAVKFSTLQWLMGVCTGTAALILGAWRLLM